MKKKFDDILNTLHTHTDTDAGYSLSSIEREKMSRMVKEYMAHRPLRAPRTAPGSGGFAWLAYIHRPALFAFVMVAVTTSSISYAAEGALPGDILYTVKTAMNEPVRVALATNPNAKAEVQIHLAERRIKEATTLAAEGRLDVDTEEELARAFESHAENAHESLKNSDDSDGELSARFETRLVAYENVLYEVERENDRHTARIASAIRTTAQSISGASASPSASIALSSADDTTATMALNADAAPAPVALKAAPVQGAARTFAAPEASGTPENIAASQAEIATSTTMDPKKLARIESTAGKSLKNAQRALKNARLAPDSLERMNAEVLLAATMMSEAQEYKKAGNDIDAYNAFEASLRASEHAIVFIKAAPEIEKAKARWKSEDSDEKTSERKEDSDVQAAAAAAADSSASSAQRDEEYKKDESDEHDNSDDSKKEQPKND